MKPALELTSVPAWATTPTRPPADITGRYWTVIAFGPAGAEVARSWNAEIASAGRESGVRVHEVGADDGDGARDALDADLVDARVGWRLMMAGPASACLRLRGDAVAAGVADDEMTVASTDVGQRLVHCAHCRTVTAAAVELEHVIPCAGCGRNLLVYYHISRRQGVHLGFMVDAEGQVAS
jgi:dimethylamine monooxygenase subunit C